MKISGQNRIFWAKWNIFIKHIEIFINNLVKKSKSQKIEKSKFLVKIEFLEMEILFSKKNAQK